MNPIDPQFAIFITIAMAIVFGLMGYAIGRKDGNELDW